MWTSSFFTRSRHRGLRLSARVGALLSCLALTASVAALADEDVSISLSVTPDEVTNPGGIVTIQWEVQPEATDPDSVVYYLKDPTQTVIIETQSYAGSSGLAVLRTWTAPGSPPLPDGTYWVRVEYYADGLGLEASAEANFDLVTPVRAQPPSWGRIRGMFMDE